MDHEFHGPIVQGFLSAHTVLRFGTEKLVECVFGESIAARNGLDAA
jgi:hypothetical protein